MNLSRFMSFLEHVYSLSDLFLTSMNLSFIKDNKAVSGSDALYASFRASSIPMGTVFLYNHDGAYLELNELLLGPIIPLTLIQAHLNSMNHQLNAVAH